MRIPDAFMQYFRTNYPGPDTVIASPDWHAPKIYRAAMSASGHAELLEASRGVLMLFDSLIIRPNGDHDNPGADPAYIATLGEFARLREAIASAEAQS